jgi:hypothetical protein
MNVLNIPYHPKYLTRSTNNDNPSTKAVVGGGARIKYRPGILNGKS